MLWSIDSCQKRYPLTSVTWLYRELKCTTHRGDVFVKVIRWHLLVLIDRRLRSIMERPYDNLSTSSVLSLQGNLRPRPWCIDLAKCIKALVSDFPLMMVKWVVYIKVSKTNCNFSENKRTITVKNKNYAICRTIQFSLYKLRALFT